MADADALRVSHGQLPAIVLSKSSILIAVDPAGVVLLWNTAAERIFGVTEESVLGHPFSRSAIVWDWDRIERLAPGGVSQRCQRIIQPFTRANGTPGVVAMHVSPQRNVGNVLTGCVWLGSDSGPAHGSRMADRVPSSEGRAPKVWRTPAPEAPRPVANDPTLLYPVHISFLDGHLVSQGEDLAAWRILHALETRLDDQGMEICFTLVRRYPGQGMMVRRVLVASGELVGVSEA